MKTLLTGLLTLICLAVAGFLHYQTDQEYPGKILGQDYWGADCELSTTGVVLCANEASEQFDSCTTKSVKYRLQTTKSDPKGLPVSLEIWTSRSDKPRIFVSDRFFGEGTGICYTEGYDFPEAGIRIDSGSSCVPANSIGESQNIMFYVDDTKAYLPCEIPGSSTQP